MEQAAPLAAGVVVPADLVAVLGILGIVILLAVAIIALRHFVALRRVQDLEERDKAILQRLDRLEEQRRSDQERDRRWDHFFERISNDLENVKDLQHTMIKGHMREG